MKFSDPLINLHTKNKAQKFAGPTVVKKKSSKHIPQMMIYTKVKVHGTGPMYYHVLVYISPILTHLWGVCAMYFYPQVVVMNGRK